jgi:hypothetical protein
MSVVFWHWAIVNYSLPSFEILDISHRIERFIHSIRRSKHDLFADPFKHMDGRWTFELLQSFVKNLESLVFKALSAGPLLIVG